MMASLALRTNRVFLEITPLSLEGFRLLGKPLYILSLGCIHRYSTPCPLSLWLWAPLILCLVLLPLITRQCGAFGLMVRVMGMLAL